MAVVSYAAKLDLARGYMAIALPSATVLDLTARYLLRKRLYRRRVLGWYVRRVVAVGHASAVARLDTVLRRDTYHGLAVVAACLVDPRTGPGLMAWPACPWPGACAASLRVEAKDFSTAASHTLSCILRGCICCEATL